MSLRQWSQIVGISASYLNLILNSKRLLPSKHIEKVSHSLALDDLAQDNLKKALTRDWFNLKGYAGDGEVEESSASRPSENPAVEEVISDDEVLLKSWLHLAILEFTTCGTFKEDHSYLAEKFGVTVHEVVHVIHDLERSGYLQRDPKSGLTKRNQKMRIPTKRSRSLIRNFHKQTLQKAIRHLDQFHDQESFDNRLIMGYTVAVNARNFKQAKLLLERSLLEASSKLSSGKCTEVYQLQLQLFPLSVGKKLL